MIQDIAGTSSAVTNKSENVSLKSKKRREIFQTRRDPEQFF